uniref:Serine racemase n=1 Tax=Latimeria chalumnae TaxID=7897 RepID=H2ZWY8_LATCH
MLLEYCISLADVQKAQLVIKDLIHQTPVLTDSSLNILANRKLFFKCELFQKTGSFKVRGALNAVLTLCEKAKMEASNIRALVTHSSGNHGQALAFAAHLKGIPTCIVVPRTAPACKKAAIRQYHARLVECEPTDQQCRAETTAKLAAEMEALTIHSSDTPEVIAGQGTIGMELLQQVPELDAVVVPVGGGGMLAGIAIAIKALRPNVKIYGAEPQNADDCYQSKQRGQLTPNPSPPDTIADGAKLSIGPKTWPIIQDLVDDVFTVTEDEIKQATCLVWERMKLVIEPTAGLGMAVVLSERFQSLPENLKNVAVILCGGNVDLGSLSWLKNLSESSKQ